MDKDAGIGAGVFGLACISVPFVAYEGKRLWAWMGHHDTIIHASVLTAFVLAALVAFVLGVVMCLWFVSMRERRANRAWRRAKWRNEKAGHKQERARQRLAETHARRQRYRRDDGATAV
jgi:hypothetical protein